jgi:hypothetical protein
LTATSGGSDGFVFKTVELILFQVVAGILASVEGQQLATDQTWKCTTSYFPNWMSTTFDDSLWPNAAIAGPNSAADIHGYQPLIDSTAKWIWTSNYVDPNIDSIVYCRGYLGKAVDRFVAM